MNQELKFEYAIRNKNGLYYRGSAYGDSRDWTDVKWDVFTYTEKGAYRELELFKSHFHGCEVMRYL